MISFTMGCSSSRHVKGERFEISSILKNDIDLVSETHQKVVFKALKDLATKLYKRNPQEWRKEGHESIGMAVRALSMTPFPRVKGRTSIDCIHLAFNDDFEGDRVKAFIVGLESMVLASYNNNQSFYLHNLLEAQKLYDSARNIELASWLVRTKKRSDGTLFLFSSQGLDRRNVSFERLFGKMISAQDMIAQITADRSHRQIKNLIQTVATAFIPI
jgi:hypothetical protein